MVLISKWIGTSQTLQDGACNNDLTKQAGCTIWKDYIVGNALCFNGSTYYTASNECKFDFGKCCAFSLAGWVKLEKIAIYSKELSANDVKDIWSRERGDINVS